MTTLQGPVPSVGLLRFLRRQTETLGFFHSSHSVSPLSVGPLACKNQCDTRYQPALRALHADILGFRPWMRARGPPSVQARQPPHPSFALRYKHTPSLEDQTKPCQPTWREWVGGFRVRRPGQPLEPDDLPDADRDRDEGNNSMFNTRRLLSKKSSSEPRLRCTEVDENGNVILVDSEFKKSELIARVCAHQPLTVTAFTCK